MDAGSLFMAERGVVRRHQAPVAKKFVARRVLVVDVGGNAVKILASGHNVHRSFPSGPKMTPKIRARCSTAERSLSPIISGADGLDSISRGHSVVR